jgi:superfamily I DNA/RNA helicase
MFWHAAIPQPQIKAAVHGRWQHVLVDESQDTNLCQFELVRTLTSPGSSLFMVGDPDQVRGRF